MQYTFAFELVFAFILNLNCQPSHESVVTCELEPGKKGEHENKSKPLQGQTFLSNHS